VKYVALYTNGERAITSGDRTDPPLAATGRHNHIGETAVLLAAAAFMPGGSCGFSHMKGLHTAAFTDNRCVFSTYFEYLSVWTFLSLSDHELLPALLFI
jgi:hypothetical protein